MRLTTIMLAAAVVAASGACAGGESTAPTPEAGAALGGSNGGVAVTGNHVIRSRVVGVDSAAGEERLTALAGVTVRVILRTLAGGDGGDTSAVIPTRTHVGTVRSGMDGRIELRSIPAGMYELEATPPASSPYKGGTGYAESLPLDDISAGLIFLYRR